VNERHRKKIPVKITIRIFREAPSRAAWVMPGRKAFLLLSALLLAQSEGLLIGALRPVRRSIRSIRTSGPVRCGFEVEEVDQKTVDEMGVFSWPGLEKRQEAFTQTASAEELLMCYVKEGSAVLTDAAETSPVAAGQLVMVNDGDVRWSDIGEGGLTLLSITTEYGDVVEDDVALLDDPLGLSTARGASNQVAEDDVVEDLSLKEAGVLLAAGLVAGGLLSFGLKTFNGAG
jgi:hypothetical protein